MCICCHGNPRAAQKVFIVTIIKELVLVAAVAGAAAHISSRQDHLEGRVCAIPFSWIVGEQFLKVIRNDSLKIHEFLFTFQIYNNILKY